MSLRNVVRIQSAPVNVKEIPVMWSGLTLSPNESVEESDFPSLENVRDELLTEIHELRNQLVKERELAMQEVERETKERAEQLKHDAWEAGYTNGKQQAEQEVDAILKAQLERIEQIQKQFTEERKRYVLQSEEQLIEISMQLARKLIGQALQSQPGEVARLVKKHLKQVEDAQEITLHVSLEDFDWIKEQREELESLLPAFTPFVILPVKELKRGDVMIHTQASRYDARIDSQLSEIKSHFMTLAEENVDVYLESNTVS